MDYLARDTRMVSLEKILASTRKFLQKPIGKGLLAFAAALACVLLALILVPFPVEKLSPPPSTLILDRNGEILRVFLSEDEMWRMDVGAEKISPSLKKAVLTYEDKYFRWHFGVNPIAILRSMIVNLKAGRIVQGASTISMQVARMMEPKQRTIPHKLIEIFRAMQLELRFSKNEILTCYFNMAPYGGNILGVGAACHLYFNKSPEKISLGEAALLAAIPNSPNALRPDINPEAAAIARNKVLKRLFDSGRISSSELDEALSEPLPNHRFDLPFQIPHLAAKLVELHPRTKQFTTTIDAHIQHLAENTLSTFLTPWRSRDISNGAILIIENKSRDVLAMVGSYDFWDEGNNGQVNGALSPRSPGSALKPFVYALGMEVGLITPKSLLYDVPVEYRNYRPVNYDETFNGVVSAEEALIRSLNVPAVNLSAQLGENGIHAFLNQAGITTLPRPSDYYGLSLILGGCEVTLLELTNLYAGLANGGMFAPYRLLKNEAPFESKPLLSEGVCFILSEMLSQLRRPDLPASWEFSVDLPKIAWKTGTSYGHRDAWSIGYTPTYTVGVWVGNFNGRGAPELVGAEVAAPILFSLFSELEKTSRRNWFIQPASVQKRQVCTVSGMPLSENCASARDEYYVPGISPIQKCTIHQVILVDTQTGTRLCSHCRIGRAYEEKIVEQWPAEIATWLERSGYPMTPIPPHYPGCTQLLSGQKPVIRSPLPDTEYKIRPAVALKYQKILLDASVSNRTKKIFWFVDGKMVFAGDPSERVFILPERGSHQVMCLDDEGRSTEMQFVVK